MAKVIVIGGGPAGMMAAITAAKTNEVVLLEGKERLGRKLYITGKGRCNITNAKDISEFFDYIPGNPTFLYSALYTFTNEDVMSMFNNNGVPLKVERGDRVFPVSDKSSDIIGLFQKLLSQESVDVRLNSKVVDITIEDSKLKEVVLSSGDTIKGDYFIFATGGKSYPLTGSTGEGYKFAKKMGHKIIEPKASLVPIILKEANIKELQGLSLKNVKVNLLRNNKVIYSDLGEMLFTHFGASGPIILSASRHIKENNKYSISINLKPALTEEELDTRIQKDFKEYSNKDYKNSLDDLLPKKLINYVVNRSGISPDKKVHSITKGERLSLVKLLQNLTFEVEGLRPIAEAIVTAGGISVKEINPSTMQSKLISNVSFCGELIDVDAFTGGYNVQIAISTGYIAGKEISIDA
ncbi:NAD(P)/FAD-dependent oxidoreductase [Alloiococcus sp. CFN-8]|uniref:NAD(P)/FAD-dependent oxidoreductase n=1 Tax=Alloiococcus sp. CFN-8 TaxID=3416081 RepID=UPI003CEE68F4